MSQPPQPPQPPNTPPDQPYGYPQQPPQQPQQPYGYPQQPAQQPYGYPQQPPAPPEQNPYAQPQQPYGYPQQQQPWDAPNPYAQPQQQPYPGQQPYAQPQQPPQAYPGQQAYSDAPTQPPQQSAYPQQPTYAGPSAGGTKMSRGRLGAMIAGIVALVVLIGGGIWMATSGGSSNQAGGGGGGGGGGTHRTTTGKLRWTVNAPKVSKAQIVSPTPGMWFSGGDVIKQSTTTVDAYNLDSGHRDWSLPAPAGHNCGATAESSGGKAVVQYGVHCENVMAVDLSSGKALWHKPLATSGSSDDAYSFTDADLAVSGNTLAVSWEDTAAAFNLSSGARLWHTNPGDSCQDQGFAGGSQMIEVYKCGYAENAPYHVRLIDPTTGKAKWTWDAPADTKVTNVISVDPVVVGLGAGGDLITDIWDIDGGRLQGKIGLGRGSDDDGKYGIVCPPVQLTPCDNVAVSGNTLFMATREQSNSKQAGSVDNQIAAFNLTDGQPKWLSKEAAEPMDVITTQGDSVVAYQESGYEEPGKIIYVGMSKGALSTYTNFSSSTDAREHTAYGPGVTGLDEAWYHGTLVFSLNEVDTSGEYPVLLTAMR